MPSGRAMLFPPLKPILTLTNANKVIVTNTACTVDTNEI